MVGFPPISSILIGFSITNHPFLGPVPLFLETPSSKWATSKKLLYTFHPTGCLIRILLMVYDNRYITGYYFIPYILQTISCYFIAQMFRNPFTSEERTYCHGKAPMLPMLCQKFDPTKVAANIWVWIREKLLLSKHSTRNITVVFPLWW